MLDKSRIKPQDDVDEIEPEEAADADELMAIDKKFAGRSTPANRRNPLADDDDPKDDDIILSPTPPTSRQVVDNPFDDEQEVPRPIVRQPIEVDDAADMDEPDGKPAMVAEQPLVDKSPPRRSSTWISSGE